LRGANYYSRHCERRMSEAISKNIHQNSNRLLRASQ